MTEDRPPPTKPTTTSTFGNAAAQALGAAVVGVAINETGKLVKRLADRRSSPRQRKEAIFRHLDKVHNIGEKALALDNAISADERQRMAADSVALCDALHEQLTVLRLSATAQKSGVLDAARTAIRDADGLAAALNKWAMSSSDVGKTQALQQAVRAIDASETALLSCMGKAPRRRPWKRGEQTEL
jgi:hypothetical protein